MKYIAEINYDNYSEVHLFWTNIWVEAQAHRKSAERTSYIKSFAPNGTQTQWLKAKLSESYKTTTLPLRHERPFNVNNSTAASKWILSNKFFLSGFQHYKYWLYHFFYHPFAIKAHINNLCINPKFNPKIIIECFQILKKFKLKVYKTA